MAVSVRVEAIDRSVDLLLAPVLSPEERSARLAAFAAREIASAAAHNDEIAGRPVPYDVAVDGRAGAPLASVRPDGRIVAEWAGGLQGEVVDWIWHRIVEASPVLTGAFAHSHVLLADGVEVSAPDPALDASEWVISTTSAYARKLEGMSGKRPPLSAQAPHGVYHVVAEEARRRFGNIARIKFTARSIEGGAIAEWASRTGLSARGHASTRHRRDWLSRQPAIVITFR